MKKVAVIDDDKELLEQAGATLAAGGYEPILINDAMLALDIIADRRPDVVLVDLVMPDKNGFELANDMNRILEVDNIPIIMMSAFFKDEFYALMNLCGIQKWLNKPFQPLDLIGAVEGIMTRKPARQDLWSMESPSEEDQDPLTETPMEHTTSA